MKYNVIRIGYSKLKGIVTIHHTEIVKSHKESFDKSYIIIVEYNKIEI